jgi:uncharacterized membrane protein YeiH
VGYLVDVTQMAMTHAEIVRLPQSNTIDVIPTSLPGWTQLAAVGVGAISGAAFAARRGFDVVGVLVLSVATGLGGLLLRDTLLQRGTSIVITDGRYLIIAAIAAIIGFFFAGLVDRLEPVVIVLDALALGFLSAAGANAALAIQLPPTAAVFIGAATAAGGLVLRDLLAGIAPAIMRPGVLIAAAAFIGALVFTILVLYTGIARGQAQVIVVVVVFAIRLLAVRLQWRTRPARDLTDRIWARWLRPTAQAPTPSVSDQPVGSQVSTFSPPPDWDDTTTFPNPPKAGFGDADDDHERDS